MLLLRLQITNEITEIRWWFVGGGVGGLGDGRLWWMV